MDKVERVKELLPDQQTDNAVNKINALHRIN